MCYNSAYVSAEDLLPGGGGGGESTWQSFIWGGSAARSNPLPFDIPFWQKTYPFYIPFIEKRYPFHIATLESCTIFLSPYNEVNGQYYGKISSIIKRNAKQTTSVIYSLHECETTNFPTLLYPSTCEIPTLLYAWSLQKVSQFRAEPPRIGQYRKYPPPPRAQS